MTIDRGELLLAARETSIRDSYSTGLQREGFGVLAVTSLLEIADALASRSFDALLVEDSGLPGNAHLDLLQLLQERRLPLPLMLLSSRPSLEHAVDALRRGAADYVSLPLTPALLAARVDQAMAKGRTLRALVETKRLASAFSSSLAELEEALAISGPVSPPSSGRFPTAAPVDPLSQVATAELQRLSPRELEVARLLGLGKAVGEVATTLVLSPNTVRNHVKSVFVKLRVHSQVELLSKLAGYGR